MSFDKNDISNKMMTGAPAKKEFHFTATAEHLAEVVYAETTEEAEQIYHKVKRLINTHAPIPAPAQSTPPAEERPEGLN